jgi:hypothetical protein
LNKCRRLTVQSREMKEGKPLDGQVFDIEQLTLVKKGRQPEKAYTGGSRASTGARPSSPTR